MPRFVTHHDGSQEDQFGEENPDEKSLNVKSRLKKKGKMTVREIGAKQICILHPIEVHQKHSNTIFAYKSISKRANYLIYLLRRGTNARDEIKVIMAKMRSFKRAADPVRTKLTKMFNFSEDHVFDLIKMKGQQTLII